MKCICLPLLAISTCLFLAALPQTSAQNPPQSAGKPQGATEPTRLELGKPIERELRGGETHVYKIHVEAGQFVHVVALQKGIDVAVTLKDPSGKEVAKSDSLNGAYGPEPVSAIAAVSGDFQLEVAGGGPPGRYQVQVTDLRTPTQADRTRMEAERVYMEAIDLFAQGKQESYKSAVEKFEQGLALYQSLDDKYGQALSLFSAGAAFDGLQDRNKALDYYTRALPLWHALADQASEAATLEDIGKMYELSGDGHKALDYYTQALPLRRAVGDRYGEAVTLNDIGSQYSNLGDNQKGLDFILQALPLRRAVGDRKGEAKTLNDIAVVYEALSEPVKALEYLNQAMALHRAMGNRSAVATTLNNIGAVYADLGEVQKALDCYGQALALFRELGNRFGQAMTLNNTARDYATLGENQRALEYFEQALPLFRAVGHRVGEATVLNNIGTVYRALGENQKALEYLAQALPLRRSVGDRDGEAVTLTQTGNVYIAQGEAQKALDYYNQALPLYQAVGDRDGGAVNLLRMAQACDRLGEKQKALDYYGQSLSLFRTIHDLVPQGRALLSFMEYWKELDKPALAIFFGKQGIDRFQQVRRNIQRLPKEDQKSFVTSNQDYYRELAGLLLAQGRLPEAEDVLGMLKEEEFKEFTRGQTGSAANLVASLTPKEQQAETILSQGLEWQELAQIPVASRTPQQQARYEELDKTLTANNVKLSDFWQALQTALPGGEAHEKKVESSATQKLLRKLPSGTIVVYTVVLDDKLDLVVISRDAMVHKSVAVKRADLAAAVEQLRSAIRDREQGEALLGPAHRLYGWLVTPIASELEGAHATTIAWSLDGVLRYIPVNVLHDGRRYLIERYTNVIFTPADTIGLEEKPGVTAWKALGLGVSKQYQSNLNALPAVPGELRTIVRDQQDNQSHGPLPGRILLDDAFTEQAMEQQLQQHFPLVHIASHFVVGMTTDDSYLLLGGEKAGDTSGYRLRLSDVETMNGLTFDATALLSLSACETAMSKGEADGKEVDSLAAIGRQRGAQAVLASLWDVSDESTGEMMADFYQRWTGTTGISKAEALRQAQLALLRAKRPAEGEPAYSHPYFWAPFILMGNWQ